MCSSRHSEGVNPPRRCPERSEGTHSDYRKKDEILPLRFAQGQNDKKGGSGCPLTLSLRKTLKNQYKKTWSRMHPLLCHPEAKPKGLLWRFFAITYSEKDEILHSANAPFRMTEQKRVRMTEKMLRRCPEPKP